MIGTLRAALNGQIEALRSKGIALAEKHNEEWSEFGRMSHGLDYMANLLELRTGWGEELRRLHPVSRRAYDKYQNEHWWEGGW
jgi:hypothetical protein